jgi:twitching motility protein PilU
VGKHEMALPLNFSDYLNYMVNRAASDLYLTSEAVASIKINGELIRVNDQIVTSAMVKEMATQLMDNDQRKKFDDTQEMNLALYDKAIGRFRVNIFRQKGDVALVVRHIKDNIPTPEQLGLPSLLKDMILEKRGLILFVGATGAGKSTSLASLIDYRAKNSPGHIISVEDPIEFVHKHHMSIVNQREVGMDTLCYENALANTLRQAPDVIVIGEIRTRDTMQHAVTFAETGHLCLSTLHSNNANQALDRIINFFPRNQQRQVLMDVALNLKAIVSQRLVPTVDGNRIAAFEVMHNTPLISELILRGELHELKEIMRRTHMLTLDESLYKLYCDDVISYKDALHNADSENNLRLRISLEKGFCPSADQDLELLKSETGQSGLVYHRDGYSRQSDNS